MSWYHRKRDNQRHEWADDPELLSEFGIVLMAFEDEHSDVPEADIEPDEFSVFPENWDVVCLYMASQTQWIKQEVIPPMGGSLITIHRGFEYSGVDVVINRTAQYRNSKDAELFSKLQVMERAALKLFAEQ